VAVLYFPPPHDDSGRASEPGKDVENQGSSVGPLSQSARSFQRLRLHSTPIKTWGESGCQAEVLTTVASFTGFSGLATLTIRFAGSTLFNPPNFIVPLGRRVFFRRKKEIFGVDEAARTI